MFVNTIKVSYRNLIKYKSYTLLNILGLSVGMAAVVFIAMFVLNEMSYDHSFKNRNNIYRIGITGNISGKVVDEAVTPAPMAHTLLSEFPNVLQSTRILPFNGMVQYNHRQFVENNFYFADASFFDVFDFPFIRGNPKNALNKPYSVVITEETASQLFGESSPLGKPLRIETDSNRYIITGVVHVPQNVHFKFDCLASLSSLKNIDQQNWVVNYFYTYVLLNKSYTRHQFEKDINSDIIPRYLAPQVEQMTGQPIETFSREGNRYSYIVQPLLAIHMHSDLTYELGTNIKSSYITMFILAAILLLVIASINFMNLATAQSATRAKEVGLRKVLGSDRKQLILQFLIESIFITFLALMVALVMVELLTPAYQHLINQNLTLIMFLSWKFAGFMIGLIILTGILAGFYPAFVMSAYNPLRTLKGDLRNPRHSSRLKNSLVIVQFFVSVVIILFTFTVFRQLNFMTHHNLGFTKEQVIVLKRSQGLKGNLQVFKTSLLKYPGILSVSCATHIPGRSYMNNAFFTEHDSGTTYLLNQSIVSDEFAQTLNLKIHEGRFFKASIPGDTLACVLNKTAVASMKLKNPVGCTIYQPVKNGRLAFKVIGVVEDFNFRSLHHSIEPMIMTYMTSNFDGYILARLSTRDLEKSLHDIKQTWIQYSEDYPIDFYWLNDDFNNLYKTEHLSALLLLAFSIISLFIASLGLFGLIAFTSLQRTREIGIRKTLGASVNSVVFMLTRNSVMPVLISLLIAWPVAYIMMHKWLSGFSYHIGINFMDFIYSALLAIAIAVITVIMQAFRAARKNPADAVKYE